MTVDYETAQKIKAFYAIIKGDIETLGMEAIFAISFLMMIWHTFDLVKKTYVHEPEEKKVVPKIDNV